jgi:hypothetical protein
MKPKKKKSEFNRLLEKEKKNKKQKTINEFSKLEKNG